jgi:hypothetical protein
LGGLGSTIAMERRGETQLVLNSKIVVLQILAWGDDTPVPTSQTIIVYIWPESNSQPLQPFSVNSVQL